MSNDQVKIIREAVKIFNDGGIVIFPTDTAYGIGCRIDNEIAIKRLIKIKQRPETQAFPVLVVNIEMAEKYYATPLPEKIKILMQKYWPGGLTVIYQANQKTIPSLVRGGGKNIGLRMPDNELLLTIIAKVGVPIIGTSANFHNKSTPFSVSELDKQLIKQVDYVIPGSIKDKSVSTVIDCTQNPWKIIRQGKVNISHAELVSASSLKLDPEINSG